HAAVSRRVAARSQSHQHRQHQRRLDTALELLALRLTRLIADSYAGKVSWTASSRAVSNLAARSPINRMGRRVQALRISAAAPAASTVASSVGVPRRCWRVIVSHVTPYRSLMATSPAS